MGDGGADRPGDAPSDSAGRRGRDEVEDGDEDGDGPRTPREGWGNDRVRETIVLVLLSVTAVLTAWSGFESSKWGGEMSIAFSEASSARIEAARQQGVANAARQSDLTIWGLYVQARATEDERLADYVEERFTDHFRIAFDAWVEQGMPTSAPFGVPEYSPPGTVEAAAADQRADSRFADALRNNQRGDEYTMLTVLFALVLFFAGVSGRLTRQGMRWTLVGMAIALVAGGVVILLTLPVVL